VQSPDEDNGGTNPLQMAVLGSAFARFVGRGSFGGSKRESGHIGLGSLDRVSGSRLVFSSGQAAE
jgi:hypothetical protein